MSNLKLIKEGAPEAKFSLAADLEAHKGRVAKAEEGVKAATDEQSKHNISVASLNRENAAAHEQMLKLNDKIDDVWHQLQRAKGVRMPVRFDRETGLMKGFEA